MDQRFEWRKDCYGHDARSLYFMGLYVGCIIPIKAAGGPFRAWLMLDDEGESIGRDRWETETTARSALLKAASAIVSAHHNKIVK